MLLLLVDYFFYSVTLRRGEGGGKSELNIIAYQNQFGDAPFPHKLIQVRWKE